jgi:hypothetical protein
MLSLVLAARRVDPSRGLKVSTFAHWYIVGFIKHFARDIMQVVSGLRGDRASEAYSFEDTTVWTDATPAAATCWGVPDREIANRCGDFPGKASVLYLIPSTGVAVYHVAVINSRST